MNKKWLKFILKVQIIRLDEYESTIMEEFPVQLNSVLWQDIRIYEAAAGFNQNTCKWDMQWVIVTKY